MTKEKATAKESNPVHVLAVKRPPTGMDVPV